MRYALPSLLMLASCTPADDGRALNVDAVDAPLDFGTARPALGSAERTWRGSVAQGLVALDAAGQTEPGLAERWNVVDDGRSYIFRLRAATWPDGRPVTAQQVVANLRRAVRGTRNPMSPYLGAVDDVVVMTPQVIELRLTAPRPALLTLLAQPELGIRRDGDAAGSGPFRPGRDGRTLLAVPADDDDPAPRAAVVLRRARAALAVARFRDGDGDLVLGGGPADWPLVAAAGIRAAEVRIDPAAGVFGFAFRSRTGLLATPLGRAAVAMAISEAEVPAAIDPRSRSVESLLPERLDAGADPSLPPWRNLTRAQRIATARMQVASAGGPVRLRVSLPDGPGATRIWGRTAAGLRRVGIEAVRVGPDAAADLGLVDAVAPHDNARWYLGVACAPCAPEVASLIAAARDAPDSGTRAARLAEADAALAADVAFVTLARPWRWSLVKRRLNGFQTNARAWHPLNRLRGDTR